ncbi:MAG: hypothetical protein AAF488_07610 [Planctomycetota bacterium]
MRPLARTFLRGSTLAGLLLGLTLSGSLVAGNTDSMFEAPVRLLVDDQPVNSKANALYPSPVLIDIDLDGRAELVVGDLWGHLRVYENTTTDGEPTWTGPAKLQADGKELKVSNW